MAIHKSQGSSLDFVALDIGEKEFICGLSYVGLSRAKEVDKLLLRPFRLERIKMMVKGESFRKRNEEWKKLNRNSK